MLLSLDLRIAKGYSSRRIINALQVDTHVVLQVVLAFSKVIRLREHCKAQFQVRYATLSTLKCVPITLGV